MNLLYFFESKLIGKRFIIAIMVLFIWACAIFTENSNIGAITPVAGIIIMSYFEKHKSGAST